MSERALRVTVLDPAFERGAAMFGDGGGGWAPPAVAWYQLLASYGVPARAIADPGGDDGDGLLLLTDGRAAVERDGPVLHAPVVPDDPLDGLRLVRDALGALVRPDFTGVLVLRLDDPGSSMRRLLRPWCHADVPTSTWDALWDTLRRFGRASVFCCTGWVEADGVVRPSRDASPEEWAALDRGRDGGLIDLECHGHTHVDPDIGAWLGAPDRFEAEEWYRELFPPRLPAEPSVEAQAEILMRWQASCGPGTTLVAPGEAWWINTVLAARARGFQLLSSWEVCRLQLPVPIWTTGIATPYLDQPDQGHAANGLPTVGYWHDRDMVIHGPDWVADHVEAWRDVGMREGWAFSQLAAAYGQPPLAVLVGDRVDVRAGPPCRTIITRAGDAAV